MRYEAIHDGPLATIRVFYEDQIVRASVTFRDVRQAVNGNALSHRIHEGLGHFVTIRVECPLVTIVVRDMMQLSVLRPLGINVVRENDKYV